MTATEVETALSKRHTNDFFITECKNGPTWFGGHLRMDAIAIKPSWSSPCVTAYEVKVSRNDFLRDSKWPEYLKYCHRFYFACPKGLITKEDIPDSRVGLIWASENGNCRTVKAVPTRIVEIPSEFYQYIIFSRLDSERTPFYSNRAEYARAYIQHKIDDRRLGIVLGSAMAKQLAGMQQRLEENADSRVVREAEQYRAIEKICQKHGINSWFRDPLSGELDKFLTSVQEQKKKIDLFDRMVRNAEDVIAAAKAVKEENDGRKVD